jgi:hypothetical protein
LTFIDPKQNVGREAEMFRWRLWNRFRLAGRKRAVVNRPMSFDIDEFAQLLSSRDPAALKQLAARLTGNAQVQPIADKRPFTKR